MIGRLLATRRGRLWVGVALLVLAVAAYYPFSPAGEQRQNMAAAREHVPEIEQALDVLGAAKVTVKVATRDQGSLLIVVEGDVPFDADEIRALVEATQPPTPFTVLVVPADRETPAD
ncbi:MAG: hypothetical protein AAF656_05220 [Planctomycetota bacterium]